MYANIPNYIHCLSVIVLNELRTFSTMFLLIFLFLLLSNRLLQARYFRLLPPQRQARSTCPHDRNKPTKADIMYHCMQLYVNNRTNTRSNTIYWWIQTILFQDQHESK